jgi:hypothetical protein
LDSNYIEFPDVIREVMPVEDGIWIGSDRLYLLFGEEPSSFRRVTKENIKVIEGTATSIPGGYFQGDPVGGYRWVVSSDIGIFSLSSQGTSNNLTVQNVDISPADSGSALFLQSNGMNQYLSILKTNQNPNNSVIGDLIETSVVRNGITIN